MNETASQITQQLAEMASSLQQQRTGRAPKAVTVILSEDTLVMTLHDALTPAEKALARTPDGAAQVQQFHRQLFAGSCESIRQEIKRITGREVREATAEIETATGAVVHAFTTGAMVHMFLLKPEVVPGHADHAKCPGKGQPIMPLSTVAASTPNYVLIDGNLRIGPKVVPLDAGMGCSAIYGFSDKRSYDNFCAKSEQALKPYPLVKGYLRNQIEAPGEVLKLVVIDACGPCEQCLYAATMEAVLAAQESRATQLNTTYQLMLDQEADAYRVEQAPAC
jgi:uncharacterized protein YbcI